MRRCILFTVLLFSVPAALSAQAVIDSGMSKAQVIAKLGAPAREKSSGTATFLYYRNGKEKTVGMADLVVLDGDRVVDAVLRSDARRYSGKSSSPSAIPAEVARKHPAVTPPLSTTGGAPSGVATTGGVMKMPAEKAADVAKPVPQARSARVEAEKAAARKPDSSRTAKPDSAGKPAKKP